LTKTINGQFPTSISPDGTRLIIRETTTATGNDVSMLTMSGSSAAPSTQPLVNTTFGEFNGDVSPDGRWLAYESDESGRREIYVRPFPSMNAGRWQVSTGGGTRPLWRRGGRELFFLDAANHLTATPIASSSAFSSGSPAQLLNTAYFADSGVSGRSYDASPDGKRFLMIKEAREADRQSTPASMVVVLNWTEELKRLVPK
jgi:serine/threonine-protein kinase